MIGNFMKRRSFPSEEGGGLMNNAEQRNLTGK